MTDELNTAVAPATKKATKKAVVKKVVKKVAKKTAAKKTESKRTGPTIRSQVFTLLAKHSDGYTGAQIMEKLNLKGIPALLKDEGVSATPRIKRASVEGVRGVVYQLTAAGRKAVEKDTVDSDAPESASGKDWPANR